MEEQTMTLISAIEEVIAATEKKALHPDSIASIQSATDYLGSRLDLTPMQCVLLSAFISQFDDQHLMLHNIAKHFGCTQLRVLSFWSDIEQLSKKRYISRLTNRNGEEYFWVPMDFLCAIRNNETYTSSSSTNLSAEDFLDKIHTLFRTKEMSSMSFADLNSEVDLLIKDNAHLHLVRQIQDARVCGEELVLLLCTICLYVLHDENQMELGDVANILASPFSARRQIHLIERGSHPLQKKGLIEHGNSNGMVESNTWQLTNLVKDDFLMEIELDKPIVVDKNLKLAETITPKDLYFNDATNTQVEQLVTLLQESNLKNVQARLAENGMRKGFTCIFYGAPGTGKTETVYQIARRTGRSILMVDVPNLRSKWVGDTEKNIKRVFDNYRRVCANETLAPILLFNEADAVLCRRSENAVTGVDKMENAMQNIILQEMENLDGIMIATTNLTNNLDAAFERRFLYKIEFSKPTPNESKYIWRSMLPDISEEDAYDLAREYSFSGGQIENIARKQIVNSILLGYDKVQMMAIHDACRTESFKNRYTNIGFN